MYIEGSDISFWTTMRRDPNTGKLYYVADWKRAAADMRAKRIRYLIIKAVQGSTTYRPCFMDPSYKLTVRDTKGLLPRGAYLYLVGNVSGKDQALYFLDAIGADDLELTPWIDVEYAGTTYRETSKQITACVQTIHDNIHVYPDIYTAAWFWDRLPIGVDLANYCRLIVASYRTGNPVMPKQTWKDWFQWQYSARGKIDGLVGSADMLYFHGNEIDFQAYTKEYQPSPPNVLPAEAVVVVNSLYVRNAPYGTAVGGLTYGNIVMVYELVTAANSSVWARISNNTEPPKWACMKLGNYTYMKFTGTTILQSSLKRTKTQ